MFERYTERARRVLFFARYDASQLGSMSIEAEHLLLGLLKEGKGLTSRLFARAGVSLEGVRKEIEGRTSFREKVSTSVEIPFSAEMKRVLQHAAQEADRLLHDYLGTEHLLLGILHEERSVGASILMERGMRLDLVREDIVALLSEKPPHDDKTRAAGAAPAIGRPGAGVPDFVPSSVVHIMHSRNDPSIRMTNREWIVLGYTLRRAIATAWAIEESRTDVPPAFAGGAYDFVLTLPHAETPAAIQALVRDAIQAQFGLSVVREKRSAEVCVITAPAGPGPALRPQAPAQGGGAGMYLGFSTVGGSSPPSMPLFPVHEFSVTGMPFDMVCRFLEEVLGWPVVNETGLTGIFDLKLTGSASDRDAFVAALGQQAGLLVTAERRDIEVVVARAR